MLNPCEGYSTFKKKGEEEKYQEEGKEKCDKGQESILDILVFKCS